MDRCSVGLESGCVTLARRDQQRFHTATSVQTIKRANLRAFSSFIPHLSHRIPLSLSHTHLPRLYGAFWSSISLTPGGLTVRSSFDHTLPSLTCINPGRWYITFANPPPLVAGPFDDRGGRPPALFQEHRARHRPPPSPQGSRRKLLPATPYLIYQPAAPVVGIGGPRSHPQIVSFASIVP